MSREEPLDASAKPLEGRWGWASRQLRAGLDPTRSGRARLEARRRLWLSAHLRLALVVGAALAVIGLTGSALVFYAELDEALNPGLLLADPAPATAPRRSLAEVLGASAAEAADWRLAGLVGPRNGAANWDVLYDRPGVTPGAPVTRDVLVDPVSGRVHGHRDCDPGRWLPDYLTGFLFLLHDTLLVPWHGDTAVGVLAVLFFVSVLSGLILWWPLGGSILRALRPRPRAGGARLNLELHRLPGAWLSPVLLAVLVSGISMNLSGPFNWLVRQASPGSAAPPPEASSPAAGRARLGLDAIIARAAAAAPGGRLYYARTPSTADGVFSVTFVDVPGTSRFWAERVFTLDAYSGEVLQVRDATTRRTAGDAFLDWQWPLHSGMAFGWPGRLAVFAAGLACPLLYVTGLVRWWRKRRAARAVCRG